MRFDRFGFLAGLSSSFKTIYILQLSLWDSTFLSETCNYIMGIYDNLVSCSNDLLLLLISEQTPRLVLSVCLAALSMLGFGVSCYMSSNPNLLVRLRVVGVHHCTMAIFRYLKSLKSGISLLWQRIWRIGF